MSSRERAQRHREVDAILERKPGVRGGRDDANRYPVVGTADRRTCGN